MSAVSPCSAIESCSRHSKNAGNRCCSLSSVNESTGIADLAVGDPLRPPAEILAGLAAFRDGVDNTLALDFVFHLSERGHDREQHRPHRCRSINITAAEVEHAEAGSTTAKLFSEREHVLR